MPDKVYKKQALIILYDYFYPGFRAGGPIQSLTNMVLALQKDYEISVITSAFDLNTLKPYKNININKWNNICIPGSSSEIVKVYYADKTINKKFYQIFFQV